MRLLLMLALAATPARAADEKRPAVRRSVAWFTAAQEQPAVAADELARRVAGDDDKEGVAAEVALNGWKLCVLESLTHWAPLNEGAGTLVDGAYGRCADLARDYRTRLQRITQDGRVVVDLRMARGMTASLEDVWRPRLIAAALDQKMAARAAATPPAVTGEATRP